MRKRSRLLSTAHPSYFQLSSVLVGMNVFDPGFLLSLVELTTLQKLVALADIVVKVLTAAAFVVGGLWTYFHYFRGRTYRPKLELTLEMDVDANRRNCLVVIKPELKNVGLSRVDIDLDSSGVRLMECSSMSDFKDVLSVPERHLATFDVFQAHHWIEAGETIRDVRLVAVPHGIREALSATVRIVGMQHTRLGCRRTFQWSVSRVVVVRQATVLDA